MSRKTLFGIAAVAAALLPLALLRGQSVAESIREVFVTNFPDVQRVEGEVAIRGAVRLAELTRLEDIIVPPVKRTETTRFVDAGTLTTAGFSNVVLSLHGQVKGEVVRGGRVGAILVPVQERIQQAFDELGLMHFTLEVGSDELTSGTQVFASPQPRYTIGFGAYRVLLYNTTDKTVNADVYAYLTN